MTDSQRQSAETRRQNEQSRREKAEKRRGERERLRSALLQIADDAQATADQRLEAAKLLWEMIDHP